MTSWKWDAGFGKPVRFPPPAFLDSYYIGNSEKPSNFRFTILPETRPDRKKKNSKKNGTKCNSRPAGRV